MKYYFQVITIILFKENYANLRYGLKINFNLIKKRRKKEEEDNGPLSFAKITSFP